MSPLDPIPLAATEHATRRHFLKESLGGLAAMWCGVHANRASASSIGSAHDPAKPLAPRPGHIAPKAKRVIYLHMSGAPSQLELFEYKPELKALDGQDCPQQFLEGKRFAFIRGVPQLLGPVYPFRQGGQAGVWISEGARE